MAKHAEGFGMRERDITFGALVGAAFRLAFRRTARLLRREVERSEREVAHAQLAIDKTKAVLRRRRVRCAARGRGGPS
jgi:hypothetical protein